MKILYEKPEEQEGLLTIFIDKARIWIQIPFRDLPEVSQNTLLYYGAKQWLADAAAVIRAEMKQKTNEKFAFWTDTQGFERQIPLGKAAPCTWKPVLEHVDFEKTQKEAVERIQKRLDKLAKGTIGRRAEAQVNVLGEEARTVYEASNKLRVKTDRPLLSLVAFKQHWEELSQESRQEKLRKAQAYLERLGKEMGDKR